MSEYQEPFEDTLDAILAELRKMNANLEKLAECVANSPRHTHNGKYLAIMDETSR